MFCDLFAGTTAVGRFAKQAGFQVISNDWQQYSYVFGRAFLSNNSYPDFKTLFSTFPQIASFDLFAGEQAQFPIFEQASDFSPRRPLLKVIRWLNLLEARPGGFVHTNFCPGGAAGRNYFSDSNGKRCDAIRQKIEDWLKEGFLTQDEYFLLLAVLLEALDKVANTASVYSAYLKRLKNTACQDLKLIPPVIVESPHRHKVFCMDANKLADEIECDVLYLDPPYNRRQYATNYHILETVAAGDNPVLKGKTGLRPYENQRSRYCLKGEVKETFRELVQKVQARHIILSYSEEGLLSPGEIEEIFRTRGICEVKRLPYKRFRADKNHAHRQYAANKEVNELLYYVRVDRQAEKAA